VSDQRDPLLDHEADGIRELDNALPRWWLYGFYFTIVFGVAYFVNYHALPTPLWGKSTIAAEYAAEMESAARLRPASDGPVAAITVRTDAESLARGAAIFDGQTNACQACHRPDLGGLIGPNLTDALWLHGCSPADIARSITTGFPERGMQPFGTTVRMSGDEVTNVVSYVLSKQGTRPPDPKAIDLERDRECGKSDEDDDDRH